MLTYATVKLISKFSRAVVSKQTLCARKKCTVICFPIYLGRRKSGLYLLLLFESSECFRSSNKGVAPTTTGAGKPQKHVLVVKMSLAITICFFISIVVLTTPFFFNISDKFSYLLFLNNISNPMIYYWLNKAFRKEYNDIWRRIGAKIL